VNFLSGGVGFDNVDTSAISGLSTGATFVASTVAGSTNGTFTQVKLEQHPVLVVDRQTGATTIQNFNSSAAAEGFDAYIVGSSGGNLSSAAWSSIAPSGGWVEAGSSANVLTELNPSGTLSLAASGIQSLGTPFSGPAAFGDNNEDVTFQFAKPGDSHFTSGQVFYTGASNRTLTLQVDPNTGEAQIVNGTAFSVSIDTYAITSASGSLETTWSSLQDQSMTGWFEANASAEQLSELLITGGMTIAPGSTVPLGIAFDDVSGTEDLDFQFALFGASAAGDFNSDGQRDGADFLKWQVDALSANDLGDWQAGYGTPSGGGSSSDYLTGDVLYASIPSSTGSVSAVPEPGTAILTAMSLSLLMSVRQRTSSGLV